MQDAELPQITTINNITRNTDAGRPTAFVTWGQPTVTDNSGTFAVTSSHLSGSEFPIGTTIVTYSVLDGTGNSNTMKFRIIVNGKS